MIGDQGTGPEQAGFGERLGRDNDARAKLEPAGHGVGLTLDQPFALKTVEQRDQARLVIADAPGELELRLDGSSSQVGEDDVLPHREAVAFEQRSLGVAEAPRDAGEHRGKVVKRP